MPEMIGINIRKVVHICILKSYWSKMTKSKKGGEFIKEFDKLLEELKNYSR